MSRHLTLRPRSSFQRNRGAQAYYSKIVPIVATALVVFVVVVGRQTLLLPMSATTLQQQQQQGSVVQAGSQHRVELFYYNDNDGDGNHGSQQRLALWDDFPAETSHLRQLADDHLVSRYEVVSIDVAHRQGLLHRGVWLAVLRRANATTTATTTTIDNQLPKYQLLLLQRSPTLKTCPDSWSMLGEHSEEGETWTETVQRGIWEELQLRVDNNGNNGEPQQPPLLINLMPQYSILVRTYYRDVQRRELQATAFFAVVLTDAQIAAWRPDDEVATWQWVAIDELTNGQRTFCNEDLTQLAALMGKSLREMGFA